jgi:hypothetical protein
MLMALVGRFAAIGSVQHGQVWFPAYRSFAAADIEGTKCRAMPIPEHVAVFDATMKYEYFCPAGCYVGEFLLTQGWEKKSIVITQILTRNGGQSMVGVLPRTVKTIWKISEWISSTSVDLYECCCGRNYWGGTWRGAEIVQSDKYTHTIAAPQAACILRTLLGRYVFERYRYRH